MIQWDNSIIYDVQSTYDRIGVNIDVQSHIGFLLRPR